MSEYTCDTDDSELLYLLYESNPLYDITSKLTNLQGLNGSAYNIALEEICKLKCFKSYPNEQNIYWVGSIGDFDLENLLIAAKKAVSFGYTVYILPNPKNVRTPDFIFEKKGLYRDYDLKTINGKNSVGNSLRDSIGQTRHVLLNVNIDYKARKLAKEIKSYFDNYEKASEIMIFKHKKKLSITRNIAASKCFMYEFMRIWK